MSFEKENLNYKKLVARREKAEKLAEISKLEEKELDKIQTANKIIEVISDKKKAIAKKKFNERIKFVKGLFGK